MNPVKIIRKLGKALRGGATFRQMFLGTFLGFVLGMIPGINLTFLIVLALFLLLNTNGGIGALSLALGKVMCLILAPLTFELGYLLIHSLGLSGLVTWFSETPVLALLDIQVYCLIGGLPVAIILGSALGIGVAKLINSARKGLRAGGEKSEKAKKLAENKVIKLLLTVAFGGQKESFAEMEQKQSGLVDKTRLGAGVVLMAVIAVLVFFFADSLVKTGIEQGVAAMNGAEVNVASASISLIGGELAVYGLQVTDPATPTHNQIQAESITADISITALLAKRLEVDLLTSDSIATDVERSSPGEVYVDVEETTPPPSPLELEGTAAQIKEYYEQVKELNQKLKELREYMDSGDDATAEKGPPGKEDLYEQAKIKGYLSLSAQEYLSSKPLWVIRKLEANNVVVSPAIPGLRIEGENLSSNPAALGARPVITAKPDEEAIAQLKKQAMEGGVGDKLKGAGDKIKGLFGR